MDGPFAIPHRARPGHAREHDRRGASGAVVRAWGAWWGPTLSEGSPRERLLSRQAVADVLGSVARVAWAVLLLLLPWWAQPTWITIYFAIEFQLTVWEPKPDNTYPFLWLVLNVGVEAIVAALASAVAIAFGVRWP